MTVDRVQDALSVIEVYIEEADIPLEQLILITTTLVRIANTVADRSNALVDENESQICNGDMGPQCVPAE